MLFCADAKRHRIVIFLCILIFKNGTRFESKKNLLYVPRTRISIVFNHIQTLFPPTCSVDVRPSNLWTYVHTPLARTSIKLWSYVQRKTPLENCCLCSFLLILCFLRIEYLYGGRCRLFLSHSRRHKERQKERENAYIASLCQLVKA